MNTAIRARFTMRPLVAALQGVFLVLSMQAAWAEDNPAMADLVKPASTIEAGVGHVSDPSFKHGDYTGLHKDGVHGILNVDLKGGAPYDSDSAWRWNIIGRNLGLDARSLTADFGSQGTYRITLGYDELPKLRSDSYQTPYLGAGTTHLTLPGNWVAGPNTAGGTNGTTQQMTRLAASMKDFDIRTERKRAAIGVSATLYRQWEVKAGFSSEKKEGTKVIGMLFGNSGGNPRAVLIPEPLDGETRQIDASVGWTGEKAFVQAAYHASLYASDIKSFSWRNPFSGTAWVGGGVQVGYPNVGQTASMPDNAQRQWTLTGGYTFTPTTRLTASFSQGRMTQNEAYLPYTGIAALRVTSPLPRASLDGKVDTTHYTLRLTSRPAKDLFLSAGYRHDERDNRTPIAQYVYIGGDSMNQPAAGTASDRFRTNLPRSSKVTAFNLDADYKLFAATTLKLGADQEKVDRTWSAVASAKETTYRVELRQKFSDAVNGGLAYSRGDRSISHYIDNGPFLWSYTSPGFIAGLATGAGCNTVPSCQWDNLPAQRKFYMADRLRDKMRLNLNVDVAEGVTVQFLANGYHDDYAQSTYGVTKVTGWSATVDGSFAFSDELSAHAFYTQDFAETINHGRQFGGSRPAAFSTADLDWVNDITDTAQTVGAGFKRTGLLGGKLELNGDLTMVQGRTPIHTNVGTGLAAARRLPPLTSRLDSVALAGKYLIDANSAVRLSWVHSRLRSTDWAFDGVTVLALNNVMGTNEVTPNYKVNVFGVTYLYTFH